ncbi:MAG: hypothetical protein KIT17_10205 [Rubrivivax sp.]|nr:hypothetical protein [Rubrivivax sp.]
MPTRKPRNPELAQALRSLNDAVQHVRNAVQGKIEQVRGTAAAEIAKAKASLLAKTNLAQDKVESVLKKTEARLHKSIVGAQKALDRAVREAGRRGAAPAKPAAAKPAARKSAARKVVKKAAAKSAAKSARKTAR